MKRIKGVNSFLYEKDDICIFKNKYFLKSKKLKEKFYRSFGVALSKDIKYVVLTKKTNHSIIKYVNNDKIRKHSPLYLHIVNYISLTCKLLFSQFDEKNLPSFMFVNCNEKTILKFNLDHIKEGLNLKIMSIYEKLNSLWDIDLLNKQPSYCFIELDDDYKKFFDVIFKERENMSCSYEMRPIFIFINDITPDVDIFEYLVKGISRNIFFVLCPKNFDKYIKNQNGKACYENCKFMFSYENDALNEVKITYPEKVIYKKENHKD